MNKAKLQLRAEKRNALLCFCFLFCVYGHEDSMVDGHQEFDPKGFSARLEQLRHRQESRSKFAARAGVSDTVMRNYLLMESEPTLRMTSRIAKALGVSIDWLCNGSDEESLPVVSKDIESRDKTRGYHLGSNSDSTSDFTLIDSYQVFASAGHGVFVSEEQKSEPMAFRADWLKREGLSADRLAVIRAKGDSMEPTISDNDIILVHLCNGDTLRDGLYVLRIGDSLLVKRLQFDPFGGFKIISDNPGYETHQVSKEQRADVTIVGRVAWAGKKF